VQFFRRSLVPRSMMTKMLPRVCLLALLLYAFTPAALAQNNNAPARFLIWDERGKYGFIDASGRVQIKPQFDGALPFSEGLAAVSLNKKWGFIDSSGKIVVPLSYFAVSRFSDGVAAVTIEEGTTRSCGYIDHAGQFVIKPQTKFVCREFKEGFALVGVYDETAGEDFDGYMNKEGNLAIGGQYVRADPFSEGLALVVSFENSVFINRDGETVIDLKGYGGTDTLSDEYVPSGPFSEGLAQVGIKVFSQAGYSRFGFVNKKGKVLFKLPERMHAEGPFQNGRALVFEEKTERVRVRMGDGEIITQGVDVSAYGYIDKTGRVVIPTRFSEAEDFYEGLAVVKTGKPQPTNRRDLAGSAAAAYFDEDDGNWMCINQAGGVVIKKCGEPLTREELTDRFPQFGESFGKGFEGGLFFSKTYAPGNQTGEERKPLYGYMDRNGRYVWIQPHGKDVVPPRWWRENYQ
jgi:hypothetical protein